MTEGEKREALYALGDWKNSPSGIDFRINRGRGICDPDELLWIAAIEWERSREKWIKVSERTPDVQEDVLVTDWKNCSIGDCCKGHLWNAPFPVTHWQPLPAPPKEKP